MAAQAKFTANKIKSLKPAATRLELPDKGAAGLYLVVQPSGHRAWAVRYRFAGKPAKLTLGEWPAMTLAEARKAAADALHEVSEGRDPGAAKKAARAKASAAAADTFAAIWTEYLSREGGKLRSIGQRESLLTRLVLPVIGDKPIEAIKRTDIIRLLDRIEDQSGVRSADLALAYISKIMNWHAARSDEFRSPIVRGMARGNAKESARERTLADDEIRAVWTAAGGMGPFGGMVRFLLLTAARRTEAAAMTWGEFDGGDWLLPASRNKTKVDLLRPLSAAARAILAELPRIDDSKWVFTNNGTHQMGSFGRLKAQMDQASGVTKWVLHDLRRTARSLMSRAGVNSDHAERCLGHVIAGVRGTYDRHTFHGEKRVAFEALATQVEHILNPPQPQQPQQDGVFAEHTPQDDVVVAFRRG